MTQKIENYIRIIAGTLIFISAILGYTYQKYWLFITIFVGLNLFQYGFTNWCPLAIMLEKAGIKK